MAAQAELPLRHERARQEGSCVSRLVPTRQQPHLQKPPDTLAKQLFKRFADDFKDKSDNSSIFYPSKRSSGNSYTPFPATPSRNTTPPVSYAVASTTTRRSPSSTAWPTTWSNLGGLRPEPDFDECLHFATPLCPSTTCHSGSPSSHKTTSRPMRRSLSPSSSDNIGTFLLTPYHLPTKTIQEMPHPALNKVLWNHMRKVTTQGRLWKPEPCKCHEFLHEHTGAEYHEGHVAMCTGLETLEFCKGQSNLGAAFANVGACSAFFPSKRRLHDQILNQLRGWLKHHLFPNDDRIVENFESFFEEQWQRHEEHQRHKPQLTHRLIKRLVSALPQNYIIHNEDHANAHLMIYCPNVYNQAAFNTWMDEKTFLLLDKSPEDIKVDMERHTPAAVRKHYKKLLDYNKPIPYMATS